MSAIPPNSLTAAIDAAVEKIEPTMLAWRRDLHEHPELGNREFRTAGIVAKHLEVLRHDAGGAELAVAELGVLVQVTPPQQHRRLDLHDRGVDRRGEAVRRDHAHAVGS